ncbi:MAG TPA: diguanylate cyclase [Polyangiaceae bacterium]|nr:diguanylate cyclase [Polyangiaceae bacterium]
MSLAWLQPVLETPRVLLIDEARESHALLERVATRAGASVQHARSVQSGLRHALEYRYDAVVVDAGLGDEVLPLLGQLRALQTTAGILLSGGGVRFPDGFSLGNNLLGSLDKPWDDEELEGALRRAFELSRARRAPWLGAPELSSRFERVLLLGRSPAVRRCCRLLESAVAIGGLSTAECLEDALALLAQETFDVVLAELCLPDACGLDAVVKIRQNSSQTPILVLTSHEDAALGDQALHAGAQDILVEGELELAPLVRRMQHARQRQRAQSHLYHGALHDELTRLAKRTLLNQRIANALARSRRIGNAFALIYVDLDHFKRINDTHGHDVGDAVLVAVSGRLKSAVREYDTVARLGGDEFAILLDTLDDVGEAETVARRVLSSLAPPVRVADHDLSITASMGISVFAGEGEGAEELLRSADRAMYRAKRAGRNTYSLNPAPRDSSAPRQSSGPISALRRTGR